MKVKELLEAKTQRAEAPKPRNFVAKNAINTGAGAHKDKKKAAKQGDVKHKGKQFAESIRNNSYYDFIKPGAMVTFGMWNKPEEHKTGKVVSVGKYGEVTVEVEGGETIELNLANKSLSIKPVEVEESSLSEEEYDYYRDYKAGLISYQEYQDLVNRDKQREKEQQWAAQDRDRGPWYLKINGKIYKQKGVPKSFDWKSGAIKYGQAILKNKPELASKMFLTKKNQDDVTETATAGATSAGNMAVGVVYPNKPGKTYKNKDGTAKNALDVKGANLMTGGSLVKRK